MNTAHEDTAHEETVPEQATERQNGGSDALSSNVDALSSNVDALIADDSTPEASTNLSTFTDASTCATEHALLFSTQFKRKTSRRLVWLIWLCFSLGSVIFGRLVQQLPTPGLQWVGYGASAIALVSLYLYIINTAPIHGYPQLLSQFQQRLEAEGFNTNEGVFVGFSPCAEVRNYDSHTVWDIGWLRLAGHQLYYVGEKLRFALSTHQVTHIELKPDIADFVSTYAVAIQWQGPAIEIRDFAHPDFNGHAFRLQPLQGTSLKQLKPLAQSLRNDLEDWHIGKHTEKLAAGKESDRLQPLQPPKLVESTSKPMPTLSLGLGVLVWINFLSISFAIATITGSFRLTPSLTLFLWVMPTIGAALQLWPPLQRTLKPPA
ncbi:MAG: hypothetical protein AB8B99_03435 [Phormidesmis sp.]